MKTTKKDSRLFARVDHRDKARFADVCAELGTKQSTLLRAMVIGILALPNSIRNALLRHLIG